MKNKKIKAKKVFPDEELGFCKKCGSKMKLKKIDIEPLEIITTKDSASWLDFDKESIIQNKKFTRLGIKYNDLFDEKTGKKKIKEIAICSKDKNHVVKEKCIGFMGNINYEEI